VPVRQILLNLILNAINAAESSVRVSAYVNKNRLISTVINDGPNFSATFEPIPVTDAEGRTGLGLWVSFRLTDQLGGSLQIKPCDDHTGTIAELILPLGVEDASHTAD
jgi:signal transduction histidine kinase